MSRLFITNREIAFINDITKEYVKDIVGQFIYYYPISTLKTQIHPIYEEAVEKIFENPIKLEVLAGQPEWSASANQFGIEQTRKLEVFVQVRDLLDKGFKVEEGDYFIYGDMPYEIMTAIQINNIFGQVDHELGYKLTARLARKDQFDANFFKKQIINNNASFEESQMQKTFEQQRGLPSTDSEESTGDVREIRKRLGDDMAPVALNEGPRKIVVEENNQGNKFYEDD
jgi:hypothetical protein